MHLNSERVESIPRETEVKRHCCSSDQDMELGTKCPNYYYYYYHQQVVVSQPLPGAALILLARHDYRVRKPHPENMMRTKSRTLGGKKNEICYINYENSRTEQKPSILLFSSPLPSRFNFPVRSATLILDSDEKN